MAILAEKLDELLRLGGGNGPLVLSGFQDLDKPLVEERLRCQGFIESVWLHEDLSFFGPPPSGSFTWTAVLAGWSTGQQA